MPSSVTEPAVGVSSPPAMESSWLWPAPDGPMMAAAWPRSSASDTPESTVSGPRGDGYCFSIREISSIGHRGGDLPVGSERALRHVRRAVVPPNALDAAPRQLAAFFRRLPQAV